MNSSRAIVGILVGGGPAPGINSVISAVTIRSILAGSDVVGIFDGFKWLMEGDASQVRPLSIEEVSRIHYRGGSYLGTSRANPTKKAESLANVLSSLMQLGITRLVTIGGDDTAFSSLKLEEQAPGAFKSCMCRRRSTMTSTFPPASRPSVFKRPGMSPSRL